MWRRAGSGSLRLHFGAAAGHCLRRRPLLPLPTIPSSSSSAAAAFSPSSHGHRIFAGSVPGPVERGRERKYDITENSLERKYKDWQKKLHPDLVHTKSEKERGFAAEQSALVIDAYRTLSRPLSRALYLLKLEGIQVDEEKTINDPELLMEMMEIREAVSDTTDSKTLEKIQSQIKRKLETWSDSFLEAFHKRDFNHAVEATQRMRYYERAVEETVKKL
ncbi:hypothetical protein PR202_gb23810 [Eleusine coracana subsp. coracana]|uniref:Co-chaperone HscB C-terminal oligomerisation domain-containing protein n=1 Tax=Eleusine coracana subsp. coracana TaxID=191504 RepID=A0AAV5FJX9_ELECO|nr:hypothetical protein PR202_gb23810 [Eleusine coracana subsp. coracana]